MTEALVTPRRRVAGVTVAVIAGFVTLIAGVALAETALIAAGTAVLVLLGALADGAHRHRLAALESLGPVAAFLLAWWVIGDLALEVSRLEAFAIALASLGMWAALHAVTSSVRRELGAEAPPRPVPEPETPADVAERFWAIPQVVAKRAAIMLAGSALYGGFLVFGVLISGDTPWPALTIALVGVGIAILFTAALHKLVGIPFLAELPPRPPPKPDEVAEFVRTRAEPVRPAAELAEHAEEPADLAELAEPAEEPADLAEPGGFVSYGSKWGAFVAFPLFVLLASAFTIAFTFPDSVTGEPFIPGTWGTVTRIAAAFAVVGSIVVALRLKRARLEFGPEGVTVANFARTANFGWGEIERVDWGASRSLLAAIIPAALVAQEDFEAHVRGIRFTPVNGRPILSSVTVARDFEREREMQLVIAALRDQAAARSVPVLL